MTTMTLSFIDFCARFINLIGHRSCWLLSRRPPIHRTPLLNRRIFLTKYTDQQRDPFPPNRPRIGTIGDYRPNNLFEKLFPITIWQWDFECDVWLLSPNVIHMYGTVGLNGWIVGGERTQTPQMNSASHWYQMVGDIWFLFYCICRRAMEYRVHHR